MNDIIKNIESAQLKAEVPEFRVGDTVSTRTDQRRKPRKNSDLRGNSS